jgi:hypothetical protein
MCPYEGNSMTIVKKSCAVCLLLGLTLLVAGMTGWAMLAIYYSDIQSASLRTGLAGMFGLAIVCAFALLPNRRRTLVCFVGVFVLIAFWWTMIPASNSREWQDEVAVLPQATVEGDLVTLHNLRNFSYRTEVDFTPHYYDKTYDLDLISSIDLIAVYWMGDAIAHIMLSFGFDNRDYVAFSIETRKEKNETYSTLKGLFKQYELIYIAGDERDLIRVRTDFRNPQEDVYLYRLSTTPEQARRLFLEYADKINRLTDKPEFYNTLTTNCTTDVVGLVRALGGDVEYSWKVLLSGYAPEYAYELGKLDSRLSFVELRRRSLINLRAHAVGDDPAFSIQIREGLPMPAAR